MSRITRIVPADLAGLRLDQALARLVPELSRRTARVALEIGCVFVNNKRTKVASRKVFEGQQLVVNLGGAFERATKATGQAARQADDAEVPEAQVVFEDDDLVVVVKPARLLTAPTPEGDRNNLKALLERTRAEVFVVHRLDLQTSGVLVFAKTENANRVLSVTFRLHQLERRYSVFVLGSYPQQRETLTMPVGGKSAITHVELVAHYDGFSWLRATLETGRTHQIRLHLSGRGFPVLSDPRYGRVPGLAKPSPRLALHAEKLAFAHPTTGRALSFEAPLPQDLAEWLAQFAPSQAPTNPAQGDFAPG